MSFSGSRAAVEINLDEFERRLRAAGAQNAGLDDPLSELARLVESSKPAPPSPPASQTPAEEPAQPLETRLLRPSLEEAESHAGEAGGAVEIQGEPETEDFYLNDRPPPEPAPARRSGNWTLRISALTVAGLAMIGAVFALRGGVPGLPKQPPFIAAAQGPTKVQPPSDETVATANDAGTNLLKDNSQPGHVKVVTSEEQPVDLSAEAAVTAKTSPTSPAETAVRGTVDTPVVVATAGSPPPMASQFPDPKPVRTVSLRPDGTPIPPSEVAPTNASDAAQVSAPSSPAPTPAPSKPPAKAAPKATLDPASAQPSTPKLELPTKLSGKSSARVVVAKTDTTAPAEANEPVQPGSPAKTERPARVTKQAAAETGASEASAQRPVDTAAATTPGGWAVQLAAPKSEAEAKSAVSRLNAKYGSSLNGATIGVHKAVVNGETIYRLRVVGLSKADAAAMCARLKGDGGDCFIAK
jgi:hypothetical protein